HTHNTSFSYTIFSTILPPHPRTTLFPYTTLFRSYNWTSLVLCGLVFFVIAGTAFCMVAESKESAAVKAKAEAAQKAAEEEERARSEEHTSELQSRFDLVCRLLLEKKKKNKVKLND